MKISDRNGGFIASNKEILTQLNVIMYLIKQFTRNNRLLNFFKVVYNEQLTKYKFLNFYKFYRFIDVPLGELQFFRQLPNRIHHYIPLYKKTLFRT